MKIYFVRHGESEHAGKEVYGHQDSSLTSNGIKQAKTVAKRFQKTPIDIIMSSDYKRSKQTVAEIKKVVKKQVFYTSLLEQKKHPSEIEGKSHHDPEAVRITEQMHKHRSNPNWHYSDEENFYDVKDRCVAFIRYLSKRKEQNILVITHQYIIHVLLGLMTIGKDDFDEDAVTRFRSFFIISHTGIAICEKRRDGSWMLLRWNDVSHLGE